MSQGASAFSIDLPWSTQSRGCAVVASIDDEGLVEIEEISRGLDRDRLIRNLQSRSAADPLIVMDIPVDGCNQLSPGVYRRLELRLKRLQMGVLPAGDAGTLGPDLAAQIQSAIPAARVVEGHPYGVLKVLHAMAESGVTPDHMFGPLCAVLDAKFPGSWPPRYKRAKTAQMRALACERVRELIMEFFPGCRAALASPAGRSTDALDAVLGLYPAWLQKMGSAWTYLATDPAGGSILLLADRWWRDRFESLIPTHELPVFHQGATPC